jgi:hypothetical protein
LISSTPAQRPPACAATSAAAASHGGMRRAPRRAARARDQRERAVAADPAVLHDGEALLRRLAAEAVRRVGEPVLVERAGQQHAAVTASSAGTTPLHTWPCAQQYGRQERADHAGPTSGNISQRAAASPARNSAPTAAARW